MTLWGKSGVQRVTSLLNAYFTAMQEVVARYGGIVSRIDPYSKGSKLLILFGAPVAHEDDAQRAASAALAMNLEIEAVNETHQNKFARHLPPDWSGPLIQHRIGITYGDTFAGQVGTSTRREYTVMGDDVNLAARLMGAAGMGQILVSQAVQDKTANFFVFSPLPPIRVKGKSRPIVIYQVDGPREDTLADRIHQRGPLVGRQAEQRAVETVLQQVLGGHGELLSILGPSGIGKSHLADVLLNKAAGAGAQVVHSHCRSYHAETPYAAWRAVLRTLAEITSLDYQAAERLRKLQNLAQRARLAPEYFPALARLIGLELSPAQPDGRDRAGQVPAASAQGDETDMLSDMVKAGRVRRRGSGLDFFKQLEGKTSQIGQVEQSTLAALTERERQALYAALWALLAGLAQAAPQVIFFEDAHWMDEASQAALAALYPRFQSIPLLVLLAGRSEENSLLARLGPALSLEPLDAQDAAALVAQLLVSDLAHIIHQQSHGNPLAVSEITHWVRRTYNISADELSGVLQSSDFLQKMVLSRLESLPEEQREVARIASVVGMEFHTGEVQALLPESFDAVTLSNHLRGLARENLIVLAEAGADARYAFQQGIVRDILYASLPFEQRRDLHSQLAGYLSLPLNRRRRVHARIAAALEAEAANPAQEAENIAYHLEQALHWQPAAQQRLLAGDRFRQQGVDASAAQNYRLALQALETGAPEAGQAGNLAHLKIQAHTGLGDMALRSGDYLAAMAAYEAARASLVGSSPASLSASLAARLALVLPTQNKAAQALQLLQKAWDEWANGQAGGLAPGQQLSLAAGMAWLNWRSAAPDCGLWIKRSRTLLVDIPASLWKGRLALLLDDFAGDWQQAIQNYPALDLPAGAALAALRLGRQCLQAGDAQGALEFYKQASQFWESAAPRQKGCVLALYYQAEVHLHLQDVEAVRTALALAFDQLPEAPVTLQAEGNSAIQKAIKLAASGLPKRWPVWNWQLYDDAFRISLLSEVQ